MDAVTEKPNATSSSVSSEAGEKSWKDFPFAGGHIQ